MRNFSAFYRKLISSKKHKVFPGIAITVCLVLGANMSLAKSAVLDSNNVTGIFNPGVNIQAEEVMFYGVGFVFGWANDFYNGPESSPILPLLTEEDAFLAQKYLRDSLTDEVSPVPIGQGPTAYNQLFIGTAYDDSSVVPLVVSLGFDYFSSS